MKSSSRKRQIPHDHLLPQDSVERLVASWRRTRPDLDIEPIEVMQRLLRVMEHFRTASASVFASHDLSAPDFAVLVTLVRLKQARVAGVSQRRLLDELGLTAGTVSVRINRLESAGLVQREPDPDDKRNAFVRLTDRGREVFERAVPEHLANQRRLLAALTRDEQRQLACLLGRLLVEFEGSSWTGGETPPLGMVLTPAHVAMALGGNAGKAATPCLLVASVDAKGIAASAGIRSGDRLIRAGQHPLRSITCLYQALDAATGRGRLRLRLQRGRGRLDLTLPLPAGMRARKRAQTLGRAPNFAHLV